jgi:hypothetical protein
MSGEADVVMVEEDTVHLLAQLPTHNGYSLQRYNTRILFICIYFCGGPECVGHSFPYVAHFFVFLRDGSIRTQRAAVASRRATNLATHLPTWPPIPLLSHPSPCLALISQTLETLATHLPNLATHLPNLAIHLPTQPPTSLHKDTCPQTRILSPFMRTGFECRSETQLFCARVSITTIKITLK